MLLNGNMINELDKVNDNSVDFLFTDPPYNISERGAKPEWFKTDKQTGERINVNNIHNQKFDETFDDNWDSVDNKDFKEQLTDWANAWYPKMRKGATFCIFISDVYISHLWESMESAGFEPKRVFNWKKPAAVPFNRSVNPVSGCEYILFGIKPGGKRTFNADAVKGTIVERYAMADKASSILYRLIKDDSTGNLDKCFEQALKEAKVVKEKIKKTGDVVHCVIPNTITYSGGLGKNKIHPTQKPQEILEYFISLCSNEGDTVMDTFAGSGSTGMASKELNRKYILIERDSKMFEKMKKRFNLNKQEEIQFNKLFEVND